jgi:hypothetical protein
VSMVMDWSGCINPAARAFGVSGLTHPLESMRRSGRRGSRECDQGLVELASDIALQAADDLPFAQAFGGTPRDVCAGPIVEAQAGEHDGV